jgi:hypothetical protein
MAAIRPARSWLIRPAVTAGALALTMAGCSMSQELIGAPHSGIQKDGSYLMSAQEQGMACRELQDRSAGLQQHMQVLSVQAVEQVQQLPGTVVASWQRLVGEPGAPAIAEYKEAQAESAALNRTITSKGCNSGAPATTASLGTPPALSVQAPSVVPPAQMPTVATAAQIPPFQTSAPVVTPDPPPGWGDPISTASIPH